MISAGEDVSSATVRSWVTYRDMSDARTPSRWRRFKAFADAFGITLPTTTIEKYYKDIKQWRVLHRKAGRDLARAIRAAYANRLGAPTLARIEREWGFTARQLIAAARMMTVDDVVSLKGNFDASD